MFFEDFDELFGVHPLLHPLIQRNSTSGAPGQLERQDNPKQVDRPFLPRMDVHENAESNTMTATFELPGLTKENVNIEINNGRLSVTGESTVSKEVKEEGYHHRERQTGKFMRSIKLPVGTKVSNDFIGHI